MTSPLLYISESKRQAETISYFGDFRDVLASGETITGQLVTITCISGTDPNPSAMLYEGVDLDNSFTVLEQRIRQGVVGCIYDILFTANTSLGNTYEKFTRLAILPTNITADQLHSTWYLTSDLYPYNMEAEGITGQAYMLNTQYMWYQPYTKDWVQGNALLVGGSLFSAAITYNIPKEAIQGNAVLDSGTLVYSIVPYTIPPETIQGNAALLSGNLSTGTVSYRIPHESIQGNASLQSGTLS